MDDVCSPEQANVICPEQSRTHRQKSRQYRLHKVRNDPARPWMMQDVGKKKSTACLEKEQGGNGCKSDTMSRSHRAA
jgi:hypothetical protein